MRRRLPGAVIALGFVSFLNDVASDIVIPLIPILLTSTLAAGPAALGLIEGAADATASLLKLWAGRRSDAVGGGRKRYVAGGYLLSNLARPLLALSTGWTMVLFLRAIDRIGKGVRSAPRDALIADVTPADRLGLAFGYHRALDNAGAVCGGLAAAAALTYLTENLRTVLLLSVVPGALCVLVLLIGVREGGARGTARTPQILPPLSWGALSATIRRYLAVLALFTFARFSETFLILRGYELGAGVVSLLVMWSALNAAKSLAAYAGGIISDRIGRRQVMLTSWVAFAASFYALCVAEGLVALWVVTLAYGAFAGLSEGAERALIGDLCSDSERGTAFGWYYLTSGLAAVPAGAIFGAVWQVASPAMAFSLAATVAALCALLLLIWVRQWKHGAPRRLQ